MLQTFGEIWEGSIPLRVDLGRAFALGYAAADNKRFPAHTEFATLWGYCDGRMRVPA